MKQILFDDLTLRQITLEEYDKQIKRNETEGETEKPRHLPPIREEIGERPLESVT